MDMTNLKTYAPVPAGLLVLFVLALMVGKHLRHAPASIPDPVVAQGSATVPGRTATVGAEGMTREQCLAEFVANGYRHTVNPLTNARIQGIATYCRTEKLTGLDKLAMAWSDVNRRWTRHLP